MPTIPNYGTIEEETFVDDSSIEEVLTEQSRQSSPFEHLKQEAPPTPPKKVPCYMMPLCCLVEICACILEATMSFWRR